MNFNSVAQPTNARGPIFVAALQPGTAAITTENGLGARAVDSTGALRLLFREGLTKIRGKTLKSFAVLEAVSGSVGVTRAFNADGAVMWPGNFNDGTSAILQTTVP